MFKRMFNIEYELNSLRFNQGFPTNIVLLPSWFSFGFPCLRGNYP